MVSLFERAWGGASRALLALWRPWRRAATERSYAAGRHSPVWVVDESLARRFASLNTSHWQPVPPGARIHGIWVEGHLSQYGPNYLARTAVAARKLHELHGLNVTVVFPGYSHEWVAAVHMYRSFGLGDFVFLKQQRGLLRTVMDALASLAVAALATWRLRSPQDILGIELSRVPAGDLIYDDTMRRAQVPTVTAEWRTVWLVVAAALRYRWQYAALFRDACPRYLVSTHGAYAEYGLLVRSAISAGATVVETTDSLNSVHRDMSFTRLPTYHQGIANMLDVELARISQVERDEVVRNARTHIDSRLSGSLNQVDVALAYRDKRLYSRADLKARMLITDERPLIFIFAHAFIDSPHISSRQLHLDYHDWLRSTLELVASMRDCHWIVKPHPSAALYVNPATVIAAASGILTVQGTVALEYACKGVPAIVTGAAFYAGRGFTLEPRSLQAYEQALREAHTLRPLSPEAREDALLVYGLWSRLAGYESDLIDQQILRKVWGYEGGRDLPGAYRLLLERMQTRSLRELDVARFVERYCGASPC